MISREKAFQSIRNSLPFIYLVIALLALRWTVVEPYVVPTGSMEPTLKPGDRLYALKCAYDIRFPFTDWVLINTGEVKRGDVILFRAPRDPSITYVKRAVGLPGDTIELQAGVLYINGEEQPKELASDRSIMYDIFLGEEKQLYVENLGGLPHWVILHPQIPQKRDMPPITVPPDHYFAMGDNRDNSLDSRAWGFVPKENLKGKAMFIWFSSNGIVPRFEKIGTLIQ